MDSRRSLLVLGTGFILWALLAPRRGRAGSGDLLSCSFCGKHQNEVQKLIHGQGGVLICDDCIDRVHTVLAATHKTVSTPIATIQYVSDENREVRCSFCTKRRYKVQSMAAVGKARICNRCLEGCDYLAHRRDTLWLAQHHPAGRKKRIMSLAASVADTLYGSDTRGDTRG